MTMRMRWMKNTFIAIPSIIAFSLPLLTACDVSTERLDETVFYDGPRFKLKLMRYYENYPLTSTERCSTCCAPPHTQRTAPATRCKTPDG